MKFVIWGIVIKFNEHKSVMLLTAVESECCEFKHRDVTTAEWLSLPSVPISGPESVIMDHRSLNCIGRMSSQQQRNGGDASDSSSGKRRPHSWHSSTQTLCRVGMYVFGAWEFTIYVFHCSLKKFAPEVGFENHASAVNSSTFIVCSYLTSTAVSKNDFSLRRHYFEINLIRLISQF
jgi:hypothetical protein